MAEQYDDVTWIDDGRYYQRTYRLVHFFRKMCGARNHRQYDDQIWKSVILIFSTMKEEKKRFKLDATKRDGAP